VGTLQTELVRLELTKEVKKPKRAKRQRSVKDYQAGYDWSEVEKEILRSYTKEVK